MLRNGSRRQQTAHAEGSALFKSPLIQANQLLIEAPQNACRVTKSYVPHGANDRVLVASLAKKRERHTSLSLFKHCSEGNKRGTEVQSEPFPTSCKHPPSLLLQTQRFSASAWQFATVTCILDYLVQAAGVGRTVTPGTRELLPKKKTGHSASSVAHLQDRSFCGGRKPPAD